MKSFHSPLICFLLALAAPIAVGAQTANSGTLQNVQAVARACPANWAAPACLQAVSASNLVMAANYGSGLQQSGQTAQAEQVKQHCAASTAATQGNYPAEAMRSAFIECANALSDIAQATGQRPDPDLYQVLVGATLCLKGDPSCAGISQQFLRYAQ